MQRTMSDRERLPVHVAELPGVLVCPETKLPLGICRATEAETKMRARLVGRGESLNAKGKPSRAFGVTDYVLLREDLNCAYPIVDGVPILLRTEMLTREEERRTFDLCDSRYAEAYEEMEFYNATASQEVQNTSESEAFKIIEPILGVSPALRESFPHPKEVWLDAVYDSAAQWDAYKHVTPLQGKRVIQLGGKGIHAVKFLLAGAVEGWLITPMLGEALCARALAHVAGVADRFHCVVGVAEEFPFASGMFDVVYSGGCLHHTVTTLSLPEAARVLREGGRFAAIDPWRAPFYGVGTKLLGKREPSVYCRPMTRQRVEPLWNAFRGARVIQHGSLTRYPLLALSKFGISCRLSVARRVNQIDDALSSVVPGLRRMGSSVAMLGSK